MAREGLLFIIAIILSGFVANYYFGLLVALPLWLLSGFIAYLFRDPERQIPPAPLGVVSPADGAVTAVEQVYDDYLERDALRVSIRMNRLGSYVTRAPIEGKIVNHWYREATQGDGGSDRLDRFAMWLQTDENDDVVLVMTIASRALKPICYHQTGERIGQGERCGLIRFGGQLEVLLPANSRIEMQVGDTVTAGSDIIAMLIHQPVSNSEAEESRVE